MDQTDSPAETLPGKVIDRPGPLWRVVVSLALPVLAQQFLVFSVSLSDRFLAGRLQPLPPAEQREAIAQKLIALGLCGGGLVHGNFWATLAAEVPWERARQINARHVAYQAAQTTAIYLS
jgi:hypothetical protein